MKFLFKLLIIVAFLIIAIPTLILGYLGFIPRISAYFGSDQPRDLGVIFTEADWQSGYDKVAVQMLPIVPFTNSIKDSIRYEGKRDINTTLTGPELSALINSRKWIYRLSNNTQIKINPDGTGEMSGILNIANLLPYISLTHSTAEVEAVIQKYHIGFSPPYYLKGKAVVVDNKVTLTLERVEIGRIAIPKKLMAENQPAITTFIEDRIKFIPGFSIRLLKLEDSVVTVKATVPEREYTSQL